MHLENKVQELLAKKKSIASRHLNGIWLAIYKVMS